MRYLLSEHLSKILSECADAVRLLMRHRRAWEGRLWFQPLRLTPCLRIQGASVAFRKLFPRYAITVLIIFSGHCFASSPEEISYLGPGRSEKADLYRPTDSHPRPWPAVVLIHGGGWFSGDKADARERRIAETLTGAGYVVLSINYRLCRKPEEASAWPQSLLDGRKAIEWLRSHASEYGVDAERLALVGSSAGGHLALMLTLAGTDGEEDASGGIRCAVALYPPTNMTDWKDIRAWKITRKENPDIYGKASPTRYLAKQSPPLLLIHGDADTVVPLAQSEAFAKEARAKGASCDLIVVPGGAHGFALQPKGTDLRPAVLDFLRTHLQPRSR